MTTQDLIALCDKTEELSAKATAGPWTQSEWKGEPSFEVMKASAEKVLQSEELELADCEWPEDAAFIAHSRTFAPDAAKKLKHQAMQLAKLVENFPCDNDGRGCPCEDIVSELLQSLLADVEEPS